MDSHLPAGLEKLTERENDYSGSPHLNSRSIGISLISASAEGRNLKVNMHRDLVYEVFDDSRRVAFLQNSPENSSVFSYCARKKHLAKMLMARKGIPVPSGRVFTEYEDALAYFEGCATEVAVKPTDGSHGTGVSTGISSREDFLSAWRMARNSAEEVIVEQSIRGYDLRVIVIGGRAVAAYVRVPGNVTGDGASTIAQLVEEKNRRRRLNPSLRNDMLSRFDLLERQGRSLDEVPEKDERVWLTCVANTSVGGEVVQFIDHLNPSVLRVAEEAAKAFPGLPQVGVDLMVEVSGEKERAWVIEVNSNPGICDAVFPSYGRPIDVPEALLDYVFDQRACSRRDTTDYQLKPAVPYIHTASEQLLSNGFARQVELIQQAAHSHNIAVEEVSSSLLVLSSGERSVTLYKGMPDRIHVISRKVSRNGRWMRALLEEKGVSVSVPPEGAPVCNQYRLVVVDSTLVAGLCGGRYSGNQGESCRFDGVTRDITGEIHPGFVKIAIESANAIFNPFLAGVDILAGDIARTPEQQAWKVNDIVCNPFLSWHHFPGSGPGRDLAATLVRALFPELEDQPMPSRCVHVTIEGKVQGVGFRDWVRRNAILHGVNGWVRNTPDGKVEMLVEGTPKAIEALLKLCETGPSSAAVSGVFAMDCATSGLRSFQVRH